MKILSFGMLYFKLPDDFTGGLSAALRSFADYHDSVIGTSKQIIGTPVDAPGDVSAKKVQDDLWDEFWDMIHEGDRKVLGVAGLNEYDSEACEFQRLHLNTGIQEDEKAE